ncbi:MAG: hypothetical protein VB098_04950 [Petrimonas sp.]|nr:hypothetical protein [Petrimonas sp.]
MLRTEFHISLILLEIVLEVSSSNRTILELKVSILIFVEIVLEESKGISPRLRRFVSILIFVEVVLEVL